MKKVEKFTENVTREKILETICDQCGKKIEYDAYSAFKPDWFECKRGSSYPECGSGEKFIMDLCQECSMVAIGILETHGFKIREEDWDY